MGQGRRRAAKQINTPRTQLKTVLMTGVCLATGHSSRSELRVISFDRHLPWDPECLWTVSASLRHPSGTAHLPSPTQGAAGCPHGGSRAGSRALEEPSGLQGLPMPRGRSRPDRVGAGRACRRHAGPAWGLRSREHCGHLRPGLRITALSASVRQPSAETPLPRDPGPGTRAACHRHTEHRCLSRCRPLRPTGPGAPVAGCELWKLPDKRKSHSRWQRCTRPCLEKARLPDAPSLHFSSGCGAQAGGSGVHSGGWGAPCPVGLSDVRVRSRELRTCEATTLGVTLVNHVDVECQRRNWLSFHKKIEEGAITFSKIINDNCSFI